MSSIRKITPEICINLQLGFVKRKQRDALLKSLMADNVAFPDGLSIGISTDRDNALVIQISCKRGVGTLVNTLDELLEHISIGLKVI